MSQTTSGKTVQPAPASAQVEKAGWGVLAMLSAAQFIMVLDTTVMNVSITQVVDAQIIALKVAFAAIALFALISLWYVRRLPARFNEGEST